MRNAILIVRAIIVLSIVGTTFRWPTYAQQPTFRTSTRLILTTVVVKAPDGTPVEGLTARDFIVLEDNEPQDIAFVEYQRLDDFTPLPPISLEATASGRTTRARAGAASDL